jgi:hypothetical protein
VELLLESDELLEDELLVLVEPEPSLDPPDFFPLEPPPLPAFA